MKPDRPFTFDQFVLDPRDARLFRGGRPVALTPRSFAVLCHLAANAGRLVSKDELLRAVWEDVCVGDGSLKVCVREIRQALGDEAQSPRFVETVHRRGYRFIAKPAAAPTSPPQISVSPPAGLPSDTPEPVGRGDELERLSALFADEPRGDR